MQSFALLLHDYRKATLCPPYLVLGLHARARPHHSIGDGQCAEGSTRVGNRECCLVEALLVPPTSRTVPVPFPHTISRHRTRPITSQRAHVSALPVLRT